MYAQKISQLRTFAVVDIFIGELELGQLILNDFN
jgi:hypothetical protein